MATQISLIKPSEICVICGHYGHAHPEGVRRSAQGVANPADLPLEGLRKLVSVAPTSLSFLRSKKCAQLFIIRCSLLIVHCCFIHVCKCFIIINVIAMKIMDCFDASGSLRSSALIT
jgi:hypothetical protein